MYVAALRDEFLSQPSNVDVAVGDMAVLNCTPPVGQPEPNVTWKKDGILLSDMDERFTVRKRIKTPSAYQENNTQ